MATKLSQVPPWHEPGPLVGMAPVMSSRSTLLNDSACANSRDLQYEFATAVAAFRAGGEAAVDAVAVGIVGDDEDALFRLC